MRRSRARIAQLREHLRRCRRDVQAMATLEMLLAAQRPMVVSALDKIFRHYYGDRYLRKLRRAMFIDSYADPNVPNGRGYIVGGLTEWLPEPKS